MKATVHTPGCRAASSSNLVDNRVQNVRDVNNMALSMAMCLCWQGFWQ